MSDAPAPHAPADRAVAGWLAAAVVVGLVLRLAFAIGYWTDKPLTHDEREYLELAESLAEGRGLHYPAPAPGAPYEERYGRAPLYPVFLAAVRVAGGQGAFLRNVRIAQSAAGALAIWCLALLARRAAGPRAAVAAAWLAAMYPPLAFTSAYVLTEAVYVPLAAAVVLVLGRAIDGDASPPPEGDLRVGSVAGVLAGAAVLVRPAMLLFLMLTGLWLLLHRRWVLLTALAAASLLVIAPWTLRNYREYGRVVLIASEGGLTFWTGNHRLSHGE